MAKTQGSCELDLSTRMSELAIARTAGRAASIYGYPLVEMVRQCRLETRSQYGYGDTSLPLIDGPFTANAGRRAISAGTAPEQTVAWVYLGDGPRRLSLPHDIADIKYLLIQDAWSECVACLETRTLVTGVWLVGPYASNSPDYAGDAVFKCPCSFVRVLYRTDTSIQARAPGTPAIPLKVSGPPGSMNNRRPAAVELWEGPPCDAFSDLLEYREDATQVAPRFYANLCRAFTHSPPRSAERRLLWDLQKFGLASMGCLDWLGFSPDTQSGLIEGFKDAARAVHSCAELLRFGALTEAWCKNDVGGSLLWRAAKLRLHALSARR